MALPHQSWSQQASSNTISRNPGYKEKLLRKKKSIFRVFFFFFFQGWSIKYVKHPGMSLASSDSFGKKNLLQGFEPEKLQCSLKNPKSAEMLVFIHVYCKTDETGRGVEGGSC